MSRRGFDIRQSGRIVMTVLLVLVGINIVATLLVVQPKIREHRRIEEESRPRLQALKQFKRYVEAREAYVASLDQAETDLDTLYEDVLSTRQRRMVEVQLELAELAAQFRINLDKVQYKPTLLEEEGLEYFGMTVPLVGGYANLRQFIAAVESSDKFLVIEQVKLEGAKDGGVLLELNITLATYFDAPEANAPDRDRRQGRRGGARRA